MAVIVVDPTQAVLEYYLRNDEQFGIAEDGVYVFEAVPPKCRLIPLERWLKIEYGAYPHQRILLRTLNLAMCEETNNETLVAKLEDWIINCQDRLYEQNLAELGLAATFRTRSRSRDRERSRLRRGTLRTCPHSSTLASSLCRRNTRPCCAASPASPGVATTTPVEHRFVSHAGTRGRGAGARSSA